MILHRSVVSVGMLFGVLAVVGVLGVGRAEAAGLSDPSALTVYDGSMTVTENGAVIENLEIRGTLRIEASNVVVRNVWVYTSGSWTIYVASGSATFDNIEVGHPGVVGQRGIGGANVVVRNADIHHVEDGIKLGSNATYSGVRVHDLASTSGSPHADAVQVEGTARNSVVKNSVLSSTGPVGLGNAAVIVKSDLGSQSNLTFQNNYMNGGNYTIFVRDGGNGFPQNIRFIGNRFGTNNRYGLLSADGAVVWENNSWSETGEIIDPQGNVIGAGTAPTTTTTKPPAPAATTTTTKPPAPATTTTEAATTTTTTTLASTTSSTLPPTTSTTPRDETSTSAVVIGALAPPPADDTNELVRVVGASAIGLALFLAIMTVGRIIVDRREHAGSIVPESGSAPGVSDDTV